MRIRRKLRRWELAGFLLVCAGVFLLPILARHLRLAPRAAALLPVNHSVWERMKAVYLPYFLYTLLEFTSFADPYRNYWACKAAAGLLEALCVPILYYTAAGAFGPLPAWAMPLICCVSAAAAFCTGYLLLNRFLLRGDALQGAGFALLLALALVFPLYTLHPPLLPLFQDPALFPGLFP